jgi:hypothetical protein
MHQLIKEIIHNKRNCPRNQLIVCHQVNIEFISKEGKNQPIKTEVKHCGKPTNNTNHNTRISIIHPVGIVIRINTIEILTYYEQEKDRYS